MSNRHLLDTELLPLVDTETGIIASAESLESARRAILEMFSASAPPEAKPASIINLPRLDGSGKLFLRVFVPSGEAHPRPAILEIHGGGFVMGEAVISDTQNYNLSVEHDAVVIAVDYRLAPECPYPGALEDCYAGLAWLFANAHSLGIDTTRVVLFGASAGGGLTAALAQLARDRGEYPIAAQFLIYPMIDCRTGSDEDPYNNPIAGEFGWTRADNMFGWTSMRGSEPIDDDEIGYFSPTLAKSLAALPPAFIAVGMLDLFMDEGVDYALRLIHQGVPTELHIYPGAPHGFNLLATADISQRFTTAMTSALKRAFAKEVSDRAQGG